MRRRGMIDRNFSQILACQKKATIAPGVNVPRLSDLHHAVPHWGCTQTEVTYIKPCPIGDVPRLR